MVNDNPIHLLWVVPMLLIVIPVAIGLCILVLAGVAALIGFLLWVFVQAAGLIL